MTPVAEVQTNLNPAFVQKTSFSTATLVLVNRDPQREQGRKRLALPIEGERRFPQDGFENGLEDPITV